MKKIASYVGLRFFLFFKDFFEHWYIRSFKNTSHYMLNTFENLDRVFSLRINFKNIFKPLYRDRTVIGYIIGFIFRSSRILIASVVYIIVFSISIFLYVIWLFIPPYIIYKIIYTYA